MKLHIRRALADVSVRATLRRLDYLNDARAEELLIELDTFLEAYVTGDEENGTEPCSEYKDEKALADIATAWLDDEGRGRLYWPCRDPSEYPGQLRYDDGDLNLIAGCVQHLACVLNRARNVEHSEPALVCKRYAAIAQATLISARKHEGLWLRPGLSDDELCQALLPLLDVSDGLNDLSFESISSRLQAQLQKDRVARLPNIFFALTPHYGLETQAQAAKASLDYLKGIGIISQMGHTDEERLQTAAQACGELCFKHDFALRSDLNDSMLPDLLNKFACMEFALMELALGKC
ncbi:hypothetical protein NLG97_g6744 [Lecanicillium saksenae]|uniref:Uncharacterized protein n=1 Tax=Lecanicillium saksenae TaxID=468837 RepID=A0ACC1QR40_9HYPO|nr:hypothetical protein NLG97_g6744 [Lecanicillium saksenae]